MQLFNAYKIKEFINLFVRAKGTSYTAGFRSFNYLRIIPFVGNKMTEAAGWIKKCMKEHVLQ